jgi:hypothetical protein
MHYSLLIKIRLTTNFRVTTIFFSSLAIFLPESELTPGVHPRNLLSRCHDLRVAVCSSPGRSAKPPGIKIGGIDRSFSGQNSGPSSTTRVIGIACFGDFRLKHMRKLWRRGASSTTAVIVEWSAHFRWIIAVASWGMTNDPTGVLDMRIGSFNLADNGRSQARCAGHW